MYVNDRDQINYHGFLKALREMHHVPQEHVSKGICTVSGMNRFENGNRIAEKLMRDRLTARLGISGETYEDYLLPKEYEVWEHRMRIIDAIEKCELKRAERELLEYEARKGLNHINRQFAEAMRFMLLTIKGATEEKLVDSITKAIKYTVPNVQNALAGEHLLADQELNLIAEQMRLILPKKVVRDLNQWRILEYEKLISYMENSHWEDLQKAKVYPKVTYYICKCLLEKETTKEELKRGLELCHNAIELLRDTRRLYYFIELTETRRALAIRLMNDTISDAERAELEKMLDENNSWETVFKELYKEYNVKFYMRDFCYLYYETECHNMVEVIETRRNMLGLSRVRLGEGICSDKTIIRFEREGRNPSVELVRCLFDKMGMCAEYRRAPIITLDTNALIIDYGNLIKAANDANVQKCLECISRLKGRIEMDLPYNKQAITRLENIQLYNSGRIEIDKFADKVVEALECTISVSALAYGSKKYLTVEEMECIQTLAFDLKTEMSEKCLEIVEEVCFETMRNGVGADKIALLELVMERLASKLGDEKKYKESCEMSDVILKECLTHYRMKDLANPIYNKIWNYQQADKCDNAFVTLNLHRCAVLCKIIKKYNAATFFQNKLVQ